MNPNFCLTDCARNESLENGSHSPKLCTTRVDRTEKGRISKKRKRVDQVEGNSDTADETSNAAGSTKRRRDGNLREWKSYTYALCSTIGSVRGSSSREVTGPHRGSVKPKSTALLT